MLDLAHPRGWGHPSPAVPWCACPKCGEAAFHLMPQRHGVNLVRECQACRTMWEEFTSIPRTALKRDGCRIRGCECQREAREAGLQT